MPKTLSICLISKHQSDLVNVLTVAEFSSARKITSRPEQSFVFHGPWDIKKYLVPTVLKTQKKTVAVKLLDFLEPGIDFSVILSSGWTQNLIFCFFVVCPCCLFIYLFIYLFLLRVNLISFS